MPSFEDTCLPHRPQLYRSACRFTGNPADAEDLVQDTLVAACRYFDTFRPDGGHAAAWLQAILRNQFRNACRKRRRQGPMTSLCALEDGVLRDDGPTPEQAAMRRAEADAALDAVLSLPALYRDVILPLTDEDGPPSYEDVARRCGLPVGTVRSRVHRARVYARRSMADRGRVRPAAAAAAALGPAGEVGPA